MPARPTYPQVHRRLEAWADRVIHIEDGVIIDDQRRTPNPDATLASH